MTMQLTDTSETFLANIGDSHRVATRLNQLVIDANHMQSTRSETPGHRGFVQIELVDTTDDRHYGLLLAVRDGFHGPDLRANVADRKLTIYIERASLADSITAASGLISTLSTDPDFAGLDIWSVPVNEAAAEGQF